MKKNYPYLPFILAGLILFLIFTSCEAYRRKICATCPIQQTQKDSIGKQVTIVTPFDTLAIISRHEGSPIIINDCPDKKRVDTITTHQDGIKEQVTEGPKGLKFTCETDSLMDVIRLLKIKVYTPHFTTITKTVPARCDKPHRTWFDDLCRYWLILCAGAVFCWIALKLIRTKIL